MLDLSHSLQETTMKMLWFLTYREYVNFIKLMMTLGRNMSIERKAVAFIAAASMLVGLGACSSARGGAQSTQSLEKGATIGISMPTKSAERWNKDGRNLKNKLEKAGYKVILSYADDKPAQQNADIENMVNNNAKLLWLAQKMELLLVLQ